MNQVKQNFRKTCKYYKDVVEELLRLEIVRFQFVAITDTNVNI